MKKNSKKVSNKVPTVEAINKVVREVIRNGGVIGKEDRYYADADGFHKIHAHNYRPFHKVTTRKEERDFLNSMKPMEKKYTIFDVKPMESWGGDWEGIFYDREKKLNFIQNFIKYLYKKYVIGSSVDSCVDQKQ